MKNLDVISKRILMSAISACMVLLCASLLVFSLSTIPEAKASNAPFAKRSVDERLTKVDIWPFGISGGKGYWIEYNDSGWNFRSSDISLWKSAE